MYFPDPIIRQSSTAFPSKSEQKDKLERHQILCMKPIHRTMSSSTQRPQDSNISRINDVLPVHHQCIKNVSTVANNTTHLLHHLVPLKQSERGQSVDIGKSLPCYLNDAFYLTF